MDRAELPLAQGAGGPVARRTLQDPRRQAELEEFGFTVVPLFDATQLAALRAAAREIGPAPDDPQLALNWSFHSESREHKEAVKALRPLILPAVDAVMADYEPYLTTFITKWPGPHSAFPPHQDPTLVDERHHVGVTLWAPLEAVDAENGMLHVVPGSHRFSRALRVQDVDRAPFAGLDEAIIARHGVGVPVEAGEAMVFDNRLIHHSLPNGTERPRVVLSCGMRPRDGRCVVVRAVGEDELVMHEVADDFYIDVLPATRHRWEPTGDPLLRGRASAERWTESDLDRLCATVRPAPRTVRPSVPVGQAEIADPGVFCAFCGSTEGLSEADRRGRTNAQLICRRCEARLSDRPPGPS